MVHLFDFILVVKIVKYLIGLKKNLKTLWPLFWDGVQLPQG